MTKLILIGILFFWALCNIIVTIRYKPYEMYQDLWLEQNKLGRVTANIFYSPAWLIKLIWYSLKYVYKNYIAKGIRWLTFAILRMLQSTYHSIVDILS